MRSHLWIERAEAFFAGAMIALYFGIISYGYRNSYAWLKEWQDLTAGVLATFAAFVSVLIIRAQIDQSEVQVNRQLAHAKGLEESRRIARNFAARAAIAIPLSGIVKQERAAIHLLQDLLEEFGDSEQLAVEFNCPEIAIPEAALSAVTQCIETAETPAADDLSKLVAGLQIQQARLEPSDYFRTSAEDKSIARTTVENHLCDALILEGRANGLLLYARRENSDYKERDLGDAIVKRWSLLQLDSPDTRVEAMLQRRLRRMREKNSPL